jgi:hypothetical protein
MPTQDEPAAQQYAVGTSGATGRADGEEAPPVVGNSRSPTGPSGESPQPGEQQDPADIESEAALIAAGAAAEKRDWARCAASYLHAYKTCTALWPLRYNVLSGYTSVLREEQKVVSDADLAVLRRVGSDAAAPGLHRVQAHFTLAFVMQLRGMVGLAKDSYEAATQEARALSPQQREQKVLLAGGPAATYTPTKAGELA